MVRYASDANQYSMGYDMARKKTSTTVYLLPEQVDRLRALSDRTHVPVAEYIRQGIDLILDKHRRDIPEQQAWFGVSPSANGTRGQE